DQQHDQHHGNPADHEVLAAAHPGRQVPTAGAPTRGWAPAAALELAGVAADATSLRGVCGPGRPDSLALAGPKPVALPRSDLVALARADPVTLAGPRPVPLPGVRLPRWAGFPRGRILPLEQVVAVGWRTSFHR